MPCDRPATSLLTGPLPANAMFCGLLSALRPGQKVLSSSLQEGTAAGAAVLALMDAEGMLPHLPVPMVERPPLAVQGLKNYRARWQDLSGVST